MNAPGPMWRAILWIERFLPAPPPVRPEAERSAAARRRAALAPQLVLLAVSAGVIARRRHEIGELVLENRVLLEQLLLVAAGCVAVAAVVFGVKAWRDAKAGR